MRKKGHFFPVLAGIFLALLLIPASGEAASRVAAINATGRHVLSIRISTLGRATRCVLETDAPAEFSSHCLSNPERIYLDLKGFTFKKGVLAGIRLAGAVPAGLIEKVRVSQFDSRTVRVVFEFKRLPDLVISKTGPKAGAYGLVLYFLPPGNVSGTKAGKSPETIAAIKAAALNYGRGNDGMSAGKTAGPDQKTVETKNASLPPALSPLEREVPDVPARVPARENAPRIPTNTDAGSAPVYGHDGWPLHTWRVVIDPGHGGKDPGTSGKDGSHEKQYTLEIAKRLAGILSKKPGYRVFLTRDGDRFVSLDERTLLANRLHADIFVSIHVNWSSDANTRGITTYFLNWTNDEQAERVAARENQISMKRMKAARTQLGSILASLELDSKRNESLKLANYVENSVTGLVRRFHPGETDWGVKQAIFYVLIGDKMPAILVEVSFLSNPADERLLQEPSYINGVAEGIASGIENYFRQAPPMLPARTFARR
ncbi:MAG: N-acetylmuramoyl-L-alanine amidase [Nitrospiraceae bacterium]|nr:N-acetylmuramoyl-L-alanine amidase [Nitrospiraceae bacterium]